MSAQVPRVRVAGILINRAKILLVKHARAGHEYFLLPGGGLEWGETCAGGLVREFEEEVSLKVRVGPLLFISESIAPSGQRHILNMTFLVKQCSGTLKLNADRRLKAAEWVAKRDLLNLVFYPEMRQELVKAWNKKFKQPMRWVRTPWA